MITKHQLDRNGQLDLVAKTIMRKKDFKTSNKKFTVESGAGEEGTDTLSYKYKQDTPHQLTNGKTMKREKFIPKEIIDEDVPAFMGAVAQAAKDGKKEFEFGGKTYKVTLNKKVADKIAKNMDEADNTELDKKSLDAMIKNPDPKRVKEYGGKAAYVKMLMKKRKSLGEEKDDFKPHMMYNPKTGESEKAEKPEDHERLAAKGWTHEEPELDEASATDYAKLSDKDIDKLIDIFKDVGRKSAQPILKSLERERKARDIKEDVEALQEADGWIAIFNGKKLEITKKDAGSLYAAKLFAIDKLKVPKSKLGLLAIQPAYNESVELEEALKCPPAASNVELNTKNRDATIKKYMYGPLNVKEPGDYWEKVAKKWDTSVEAAKKSLCENCVAFDISPRMKDCMPGKTSDDEGELGYCWMHHFKCHSARACTTWAKGGPIKDDKTSEEWQNKSMNESTDLQEAKRPFKELEKAWIRSKGNEKAREKLVKKHNLKPIISNVRPGAIKLGPLNDLKAKTSNHTMAGLDAEGELIFVTNNPVKIYYSSNTKARPEGEEMKEDVSMKTQRLRRVVQLSLNESDIARIDDFIVEENVELNMTPSKIQSAYKKYVSERKGDYEIYHNAFFKALEAAENLAKKQGYEIPEDEWFNSVSAGPKKPSAGKTNRYSIELTKNGKPQKKRLQFQVYGMESGNYELNAYIA